MVGASRRGLAVRSSYGSGRFGTWLVADLGLPYYRYDVDEQTDPIAQSPLPGLGTAATHLVGNDHISAIAFNHGYTQFWSSDRRFQWLNLYSEPTRHYAGGYGYRGIPGAPHLFDWEGQNCEQATWLVMNSIQLAGIASTESGFTIFPHLPLDRFSLAFPRVGLEVDRHAVRGYVRTLRSGDLVFRVHLSDEAPRQNLDVRVRGQRVASSVAGNWVQFTVHSEAGSRAEWSVSWR